MVRSDTSSSHVTANELARQFVMRKRSLLIFVAFGTLLSGALIALDRSRRIELPSLRSVARLSKVDELNVPSKFGGGSLALYNGSGSYTALLTSVERELGMKPYTFGKDAAVFQSAHWSIFVVKGVASFEYARKSPTRQNIRAFGWKDSSSEVFIVIDAKDPAITTAAWSAICEMSGDRF